MANLAMLLDEYRIQGGKKGDKWLNERLLSHLSEVSKRTENANVLMYFSAFVQRPDNDGTSMKKEDINGIMNALYKVPNGENLVFILHTPGGDVMAAEQIINYIHSKFKKITAIVPVMSMSAGSMIALSCDEIIISRAGQLGPTDPQIGPFSVKDIIAQFDMAREKILANEKEKHVWAPILQSYGPALYMEAVRLEKYAKIRIRKWLKRRGKDGKQIAEIIKVFHERPNFHGERIDYDIMKNETKGLNVGLLEEDKRELQDDVMQAYHLATIHAGVHPLIKIIVGNSGYGWSMSE